MMMLKMMIVMVLTDSDNGADDDDYDYGDYEDGDDDDGNDDDNDDDDDKDALGEDNYVNACLGNIAKCRR